MSYNNIFLETFNQIAKVVINRPKKLNSLNIETIAELHQAISIADRDNNIRVIIITGAGEKAFVAGADISEFSNFTANQGLKAYLGQKFRYSSGDTLHKDSSNNKSFPADELSINPTLTESR